jgi:hypothetical protein
MLISRFSRALTAGAACVIIASSCSDVVSAPPVVRSHAAATSSAFIWALVVDPSGGCITGATIYVVSGPGAGQTFVQDPYCDAWSYSGGVWFESLEPGTTMTLRATAPGYSSMEKTVTAVTSGQATEFDLDHVPWALSVAARRIYRATAIAR